MAKAHRFLESLAHPNQFRFGFTAPGTKVDYERELGTGLESNVLLAPILYIARVYPEAKLVIKTENKADADIDPMHPLAALIRAPNPHYSGTALMTGTLLSYFLDGNAYWAKVRGSNGGPGELWYLPHWMVEPIGTDKDFLTGYRYTNGRSAPTTILPENIVHIRYGLDPNDVRKGFSPLKSAIREAFMDSEASNLVAALLVNRGIPGMIIAPEKDVEVSADDLKANKDYINERFTGDRRGGAMAVTSAIKVHEFGFNPQELDLSHVHNLSEERVSALIGLPAAITGFGTGINQTKVGATLKELRQLSWTDCINPTQDSISSDITRALGPDFGLNPNQSVAYDRSKVGALQDNLDKQSERLDRGVRGGWIQVAEAREASGLEVDDSHRVFLRGINLIEVDASGEEVLRGPQPSEGDEPEEEENPEGGKSRKGHRRRRRLTHQQSAALHVMDRLRPGLEAQTLREVTKFLEEFGAEVEKTFLELFMPKTASDDFDIDTLFNTMGMEEFEDELSILFGGQYVRAHGAVSGSIESAVGASVSIPDAVERQILELGRRRSSLVNLTKDARRTAFDVLAESRELGEGPVAAARKLREKIPAGRFKKVSTRAKLIARTETRFAQNESALRTYENMEGVTGVQMVDARLGETDADCMRVNGTIATFDEGRRLIVAEHPNGTRDMVPFFGELPSNALV